MNVAKTIDRRISRLASITTPSAGRRASLRQPRVLAEPARDVLDIDDRVVHERADGNRHPAEGHAVDRQSRRAQAGDRGEERQRDRQQRDGAGAQAGEKDQRDRDHQQHAVAQCRIQVVDGQFDEVRLAEETGGKLHPGRQFVREFVEDTVQLARQGQCVDVRLAVDAEDHGRAPVVRSVAPLEGFTDPQLGDVADTDRPHVAGGDHRRADAVEAGGTSGPLDQILLATGEPEPGGGVPGWRRGAPFRPR